MSSLSIGIASAIACWLVVSVMSYRAGYIRIATITAAAAVGCAVYLQTVAS